MNLCVHVLHTHVHIYMYKKNTTVSCVCTECEVFAGLSHEQEVLLTHGDSVDELSDCCQAVAHSGNLIAAIQHKSLKIYGVQFHPEVDLTDNGADMMRNFLYNVR